MEHSQVVPAPELDGLATLDPQLIFCVLEPAAGVAAADSPASVLARGRSRREHLGRVVVDPNQLGQGLGRLGCLRGGVEALGELLLFLLGVLDLALLVGLEDLGVPLVGFGVRFLALESPFDALCVQICPPIGPGGAWDAFARSSNRGAAFLAELRNVELATGGRIERDCILGVVAGPQDAEPWARYVQRLHAALLLHGVGQRELGHVAPVGPKVARPQTRLDVHALLGDHPFAREVPPDFAGGGLDSRVCPLAVDRQSYLDGIFHARVCRPAGELKSILAAHLRAPCRCHHAGWLAPLRVDRTDRSAQRGEPVDPVPPDQGFLVAAGVPSGLLKFGHVGALESLVKGSRGLVGDGAQIGPVALADDDVIDEGAELAKLALDPNGRHNAVLRASLIARHGDQLALVDGCRLARLHQQELERVRIGAHEAGGDHLSQDLSLMSEGQQARHARGRPSR